MEQQTISITKAGVRATLNARTSILAAANPVGGRYDRTKSLPENITLSPPIMSRFDLFFILIDEGNELIDYAIARKIVDLHNNDGRSQPVIYSKEDVRRYIQFARMFTPKLSNDSRDYLVEQYRHLRQRDTGGISKSSWRITVRQLESMIRLAEAIARMYCSEEVTPKYVKEAHRLLSQSIIRVEQPDINLKTVDFSNEMEVDKENVDANVAAQDEDGPHKVPTASLTITYEEFSKISNLLIHRLLSCEEKNEEGMKREELVSWYLEQIEGDVETEEDLVNRKDIADLVVDRLVRQDGVLLALGDDQTAFGDNAILVVHPNYVPDSML